MSLRNIVVMCVVLTFLGFSITACEKEGTAEKAGKKVDQALDSAKKKYDETTK